MTSWQPYPPANQDSVQFSRKLDTANQPSELNLSNPSYVDSFGNLPTDVPVPFSQQLPSYPVNHSNLPSQHMPQPQNIHYTQNYMQSHPTLNPNFMPLQHYSQNAMFSQAPQMASGPNTPSVQLNPSTGQVGSSSGIVNSLQAAISSPFKNYGMQPLPSGPSVILSPLTLPANPIAYYDPPVNRLASTDLLDYYRLSIQVMPQSQALLSRTKIPLGLVVSPYGLEVGLEKSTPVISGLILRCRRCRSYMNPFIEWYDAGSKYKCNLCFYINDVPPEFDYDVNTKRYIDRQHGHPELLHPVVEYLAPAEYMVRPPQANSYYFLIDVTYSAIQNGMVAVAARTIQSCLDSIPNKDGRTKIGFCLVDDRLTFINFNSSLKDPQLLVVCRDSDGGSGTDQLYLPRPEDLSVNLSGSRLQIDKFLQKLGMLYVATQSPQPMLATAFQSAHKLLAAIGGKIVCLLSSLPGRDAGELKRREDPSMLGTEKESSLFHVSNKFYKDLAVDCSRDQVCVDYFLFPSTYIDIASLAPLSKFTGGRTFYYPGFHASHDSDVQLFTTDMGEYLSTPMGLEAVLRVRASKGISVASYHGNFFIRQTDLLSLAGVNPNHSYSVDLSIEEPLAYSTAYIQTALLHTTAYGERRIRVLTIPIPVSSHVSECFTAADPIVITNLLMKHAASNILNTGGKLEHARDFIVNKTIDILTSVKMHFAPQTGASPQILVCDNLIPFPLLILGAIKSLPFRSGARLPSDFRSYYLGLLGTMSASDTALLAHPTLYPLHDLHEDMINGEKFYLPRPLNLTSEKLERHGLYLLDNGVGLFLWVGLALSPSVCEDIFGIPQIERIHSGKMILPQHDASLSKYVRKLLKHLHTVEPGHSFLSSAPVVWIVKEDAMTSDVALKTQFLSMLVEDRMDSAPSYPQFLAQIRDKINATSSN